jgi:hypothetical protein
MARTRLAAPFAPSIGFGLRIASRRPGHGATANPRLQDRKTGEGSRPMTARTWSPGPSARPSPHLAWRWHSRSPRPTLIFSRPEPVTLTQRPKVRRPGVPTGAAARTRYIALSVLAPEWTRGNRPSKLSRQRAASLRAIRRNATACFTTALSRSARCEAGA